MNHTQFSTQASSVPFFDWLNELSTVLDGETAAEISSEENVLRLRNILQPTVTTFLDVRNFETRGVKHILMLFNHIVKKSPAVFCQEDNAKHSGPFLMRLLSLLGASAVGLTPLQDDIITSIVILLKLLYSKALFVVCELFHDLVNLSYQCCQGHCTGGNVSMDAVFARTMALLQDGDIELESPVYALEDPETATQIYVATTKLIRNILGLAAPFLSEFCPPAFWLGVASHVKFDNIHMQQASLGLLSVMLDCMVLPSITQTEILESLLTALMQSRSKTDQTEMFKLIASCVHRVCWEVPSHVLRVAGDTIFTCVKSYLAIPDADIDLTMSLISVLTVTVKNYPQAAPNCLVLLDHLDNLVLHDSIVNCLSSMLKDQVNPPPPPPPPAASVFVATQIGKRTLTDRPGGSTPSPAKRLALQSTCGGWKDLVGDSPSLLHYVFKNCVPKLSSQMDESEAEMRPRERLNRILIFLRVASGLSSVLIDWDSIIQSLAENVKTSLSSDEMHLAIKSSLCLLWCASRHSLPISLYFRCADVLAETLSRAKVSPGDDPETLSSLLASIRCGSALFAQQPAVLDFVQQALSHPSENVRCEAVETYCRLGTKETMVRVLHNLAQLTTDTSNLVTAAVARNLGVVACVCASEPHLPSSTLQLTISSQVSEYSETRAGPVRSEGYVWPLPVDPYHCPMCVNCDERVECAHHPEPLPPFYFEIDLAQFLDRFSVLLESEVDSVLSAFLDSVPALLRHASVASLTALQPKIRHLLSFVTHSSEEIRYKMSPVIGAMVCGPLAPLKIMFPGEDATKSLYHFLETASNSRIEIRKSICFNFAYAAASFASKSDIFLTTTIHLLFTTMICKDVSISAAAYNALRQIAYRRKTTLQILLDENCQYVYELLLTKFSDDLWSAISRAFDRSKPSVLNEAVQSSLHRVIKKEYLPNIDEIARCLGQKRSDLIVKSLDMIVSSLFAAFDETEFTAAMLFLWEITDLTVPELTASATVKNTIFPLLWDLGDPSKPQELLQRRIMIVWDVISNPKKEDLPPADRIASNFLDIIDYVILRSSKSDIFHKRQGLRVVSELMTLMEDNLKSYVPKVMSALTFFASQPELRSDVCATWMSLVKLLGPHSKQLRSNFSQIVVNVLGFLSSDSETVSKILQYLMIENRELLRGYFKDVPIMPQNPALEAVNKVFFEEVSSGSPKDSLMRIKDCLGHQDSNVTIVALKEVIRILDEHRVEMRELLLGQATDPVIRDLVGQLLKGCCSPVPTVRFKSAKCLGGLGAIDPARLQIKGNRKECSQQSDKELARELIVSHLVRQARGTNTNKNLTMALFAIQELLKFLGCKDDSLEETAKPTKPSAAALTRKLEEEKEWLKQWKEFDVEVQEVIHPCLRSRYKRVPHPADDEQMRCPIFTPTVRFELWIGRWCVHLIKQCRSSRDAIFKPCRTITRQNVSTAMFLLPHLVYDTLCYGSDEDRENVRGEVMAILSHDNSSGAINDSVFQTVFTLIDTLNRWNDSKRQRASETAPEDPVTQFLNSIPKETMAKMSYHCKAFARALMYQEAFMREISASSATTSSTNKYDKETVAQLQRIYVNIDEPDGLKGIARLQTDSDLTQRVLDFENALDWNAALACYEQMLQGSPDQLQYHHGLLRCLHHLGHFETMLSHSSQLDHPTLRLYGLQAAWRLRRWERVQEVLPYVPNDNFECVVAQCLLALHKGDIQVIKPALKRARNSLNSPLAAASMESYARSLPFIVQLHVLREIDDVRRLCIETPSDTVENRLNEERTRELNREWDARLKLLQPSVEQYEVILAVRRVINSMAGLNVQIGESWLQLSKVASVTGDTQAAMSATLQASMLDHPRSTLQRAKLMWVGGIKDSALEELHRYLNARPKPDAAASPEEKKVWARTALHYWKWMSSTNRVSAMAAKANIEQVLGMVSSWEKGHFEFAKLLDSIFQATLQRAKSSDPLPTTVVKENERRQELETIKAEALKLLPNVLRSYGESLRSGCRHAHTALPRLLTLWFQHTIIEKQKPGSVPSKTASMSAALQSQTDAIKEVQDFMKKYVRSSEVPAYLWMTAMPQLVSRICHPNEDVANTLHDLLARICISHPQQSLWALACVRQSTRRLRKDAANKISHLASQDSKRGKLFKEQLDEFDLLAGEMVKLCNQGLDLKDKKQKLIQISAKLQRMTTGDKSLRVIVPLQSALTPQIPDKLTDEIQMTFNQAATILNFDSNAEVMSSAQRPLKVGLTDSAGVSRHFLCKPKDDLRKDSRLMEFSSMVNRLLQQSGSGRRKMHLRTFAVIPLNENCGLLEWVPNTATLRSVLASFYNPIPVSHATIQEWHKQCSKKGGKTNLLDWYHKMCLHFPRVLHKWLLNSFPDPAAWFEGRVAYARTAAVWSIVGYVVGLGDRHAENVLLDTSNGECVHVDFACLFNKGEELSVPERVPFRLTPNMVDALGVCGHAGMFRETCVLTLSVLRSNHDTLMNVLDSFLHDPLVEWSAAAPQGSEGANPGAVKHCLKIEGRLQGMEGGQQLSPEGQADCLIAQATDEESLSRMYIWWMAFY